MRFGPTAALALASVLALGACDLLQVPRSKPRARPAGLSDRVEHEPSARSAALARYYERRQSRLLAQGLLRTGGGGVDTPYTEDDLARNFEAIAFNSEHGRCGALRPAPNAPQILRKWVKPVRIGVEFGHSVDDETRRKDVGMVKDFAARLGRVTGHPISVGGGRPNFHVIVAGEDDRDQTVARIRELSPDICGGALELIETLPRDVYCLVLTFADAPHERSFEKAIALIRAENPELMRRACIHEELAQGLGLANDSPRARPSIFNDDDEFALLTTHDEELLRLLYHPSLRPGMTLGQARPLIRRILAGDPGQI